MTINKRRFIRLDEIPEKTSLTQGDVLDAIDSGALYFSALIDVTSIGAAVKKDNQWQVSAVFDYRGMTALPVAVSKRFALAMEPQETKHHLILQPEHIRNWRTVSDGYDEIQAVHFHYVERLSPKPKSTLMAFGCVQSVPSATQSVSNFMGQIADIMPGKYGQAIKAQCPEDNTIYLELKPLEIQPQRLRIDLNLIAEVFGTESIKGITPTLESTTTPDSLEPPEETNPLIVTNPIKQILHRVISKHPKARSDKVLVLLRQDIRFETGRKFDTDAVIDRITNDDITYFGRGDSVLTMSYRRFQNLLSEVRKEAKN